MKSFSIMFLLKDDVLSIEKYKQYHAEVWPEVVSELRNIGISKLKVFLQGRQVFVYHEVPDFTMQSLINFHKSYIKKDSRVIMILGSKENLEIEDIKKYGEISFLTLEDIFGY